MPEHLATQGLATSDQGSQVQSECKAFSEHINNILSPKAKELSKYLPISSANFFQSLRDGIVLAYLVDAISPGVVPFNRLAKNIDLELLNQPKTKAIFEVTENLNILVESAKKAKLVVVNLGANDILDMKKDLVLGLLWQIVRSHLLSAVNIVSHPELIRILQKGETLSQLLNMSSEQILLRWFNYHLNRSGYNLSVDKFGADLSDSASYAALLGQIAPKVISADDVQAVFDIDAGSENGKLKRADLILEYASRLGCRKFVTAKDIVAGFSKLNLGFTATIFNQYIGIRLPTEEEIAELYDSIDALRDELATLKSQKFEETGKYKELIADYSERIKLLEHERQLEKEKFKNQLAAVESQVDIYKKEIEAKYQEAMLSKLDSEKRGYEDSLRKNSDKEREYKRTVEKQLRQLKTILLQAKEKKNAVQSSNSMTIISSSGPVDLETLLKEIVEMTKALVLSNVEMTSNIEKLNDKIKQNDRINDVMGSKIREFSELLINEKKVSRQGSTSRKSKLGL